LALPCITKGGTRHDCKYGYLSEDRVLGLLGLAYDLPTDALSQLRASFTAKGCTYGKILISEPEFVPDPIPRERYN